jgi:hypothetical protein
MAEKAQRTRQTNETVRKREPTRPAARKPVARVQQADLGTLQRAAANPCVARHSDILALQHTVGNRAVTRLIQTKLTVGPAGDRYEQEADRVAEQVMTMPPPRSAPSSVQRAGEEEEVQTKPLAASITPLVQRQQVPEEEEVQTKSLAQRQEMPEEEEVQTKPLVQRQEVPEEEEVQTKPLVQRQEMPEEEEIQTKPLVQRQEVPEEEEVQTKPLVQRRGDGSFEASPEFESRLVAHKGGGSPLPEDVRAYMEPRFGADFGGVRLHTGGEAAQLNRAVSAQAFTHGQDIYMSDGKYNPGSDAGKQLLAHELTHVVQQSGRQVQQAPPLPHAANGSRLQRNPGSDADEERLRPKSPGQEDKVILEKGKDVVQRNPDDKIPSGPAWNSKKRATRNFVLDKPAPIRSNTQASTTQSTGTSFAGSAAVDAKKKKWRYQLDSVTANGKIQIVYYAADRYPAPTPEDDSGALTNVTQANWKVIVKDLDKNKKGIADHWSAYLAEDLHENFHWKGEWQPLLRKAVVSAENAIAKLGIGFDKAANAGAAETLLKPSAEQIFDKAVDKAKKSWAKKGDSPGDPPYKAQAPAIEALLKRVRELAKKQKW